METNGQDSHGLSLLDRRHAEISGVSDVDCFNEQLIVLATALGTMTIRGNALNIAQLNQEEGRLIVDGEFDSIEYSGGTQKKSGFFARLLR